MYDCPHRSWEGTVAHWLHQRQSAKQSALDQGIEIGQKFKMKNWSEYKSFLKRVPNLGGIIVIQNLPGYPCLVGPTFPAPLLSCVRISKMAGWRRKSNPSSRLREGLEYSRVDFYKAIYAIRCRIDRQTKGIACAVNIDGQNSDETRDSALLITWGEIGKSTDFFMDRFSRKCFGEYHLLPLSISSNGHFSLIRGSRENSKDRWDLVCLEIKYLELEEQTTDFRVYTIKDGTYLPLELRYNQTASNHDLIIDDNLFDLKLCGAPIIAGEKYFVGVLMKDPDHPGKFIPCFISKGVLGE